MMPLHYMRSACLGELSHCCLACCAAREAGDAAGCEVVPRGLEPRLLAVRSNQLIYETSEFDASLKTASAGSCAECCCPATHERQLLAQLHNSQRARQQTPPPGIEPGSSA